MKPLPTRAGGKERTDSAQYLAMALEQAIALIAQISTRQTVSLSHITRLTFRNAVACEEAPPETAASPQSPVSKHPLQHMPHYVYVQLVQMITQVQHTRNGILDACAAASIKLMEISTAAEMAPPDINDSVWAKEMQTEIAVLRRQLKEENAALEAMEEMRVELRKRWRAVTGKGCVPEPDIWVQDLNEGALKEPFGME